MFYCEECRVERTWPQSLSKSTGDCELCGKVRPCHDIPSRALPLPRNPTGCAEGWMQPKIGSIGDKTLREMQSSLPWTVHYHHDFRASPMTHKDFGHALLHVSKAVGKLAALVNDAEHGGCAFAPEETDRFVADLVVCALRMANTCPGHVIDLQREVEQRIETKNAVEAKGEKQ